MKPRPARREWDRLRDAVVLAIAAALVGCVTTDPQTGERRVDAASTALAVGALAAVGAVAYAASDDDDDDDDHDDRWARYYRPARGVRCYREQRACYDRHGYSASSTRREFGRRW